MWRNNVFNLWCFVAFYTVFLQKPVCRDLPAFDKYHEWPLIPPSAGEKVWDWDMRLRHAGGSNHFKACWASKCHQASTHGLFFDSETYLWSLNEVMTYNISWSWLSQYCCRMRKATRPWSQSLASLDRSFQRRTFTYFHFFFNFTFFQRRTFTYFHQLLHFWYHHHCFHWPIQIYSFQRWQKWSDENALFANLIIETNY